MILQLVFVFQIALGFAARRLVERRLGDEDMAALDQFRHLPVEEGQQQRADMGAVHVGVGHDDDLVVAQLVGIELLAPDAGAQRGDQGGDFLARQHLVEARALDVEDLAAQRQHRLVGAVARLLGAAAGAVALDDEDFAFGGIAFLAIGQLAGQRGAVQRALAAGQFARLARGFAGRGRFDHLADDGLGFGGMFLEPARRASRSRRLRRSGALPTKPACLWSARRISDRALSPTARRSGLRGNRRRSAPPCPSCARHDSSAYFVTTRVSAGAEAGQMRAAVALRDVVGEDQHALVIAVVPGERDFHGDAFALGDDHDRVGDQRILGAVEIAHELLPARPRNAASISLGSTPRLSVRARSSRRN